MNFSVHENNQPTVHCVDCAWPAAYDSTAHKYDCAPCSLNTVSIIKTVHRIDWTQIQLCTVPTVLHGYFSLSTFPNPCRAHFLSFFKSILYFAQCKVAQLYSGPVDTMHSCTRAQSIQCTIVLFLSRHGTQLHSCAIESCSDGGALLTSCWILSCQLAQKTACPIVSLPICICARLNRAQSVVHNCALCKV